jgi:hypothetical protein
MLRIGLFTGLLCVNSQGNDACQPKRSPETKSVIKENRFIPTTTSGPWKCSSGCMYELLNAKWSRTIARKENTTRNRHCSVDCRFASPGLLTFLDWTAMSESRLASSSERQRSVAFHLWSFVEMLELWGSKGGSERGSSFSTRLGITCTLGRTALEGYNWDQIDESIFFEFSRNESSGTIWRNRWCTFSLVVFAEVDSGLSRFDSLVHSLTLSPFNVQPK